MSRAASQRCLLQTTAPMIAVCSSQLADFGDCHGREPTGCCANLRETGLENQQVEARPQPSNPTTRRSKRRRVVTEEEPEGGCEGVGGESEVKMEMDALDYGEELDLDTLPDMTLYDI